MAFTMTFDRLSINPKALSIDELKKIAIQEVQGTITRTVQEQFKGVNADGKPFRPYSKSYAEKRAKSGLSKKVKDGAGNRFLVDLVTLNVTGELKGSRQVSDSVKATADGAEGVFVGNHKGGLSNAKLASILEDKGFKDFHAFGEKDIKRIETRFEKEIEKKLDQLVDVKKGA